MVNILKNETKAKKEHRIMERFLESDLAKDAKNGMDVCMSGLSCSISGSIDTGNNLSGLALDLSKALLVSCNHSLEKNLTASSEVLKCKNIEDFLAFQKTIAENNVSNIFELYTNLTIALQNYFLNKMKLSTDFFDKNIKCMKGS